MGKITLTMIEVQAMPVLSSLGRRVAQLREARSWTQKQLASEADLSSTFISEIEHDKRNVSSEVLLRLADALDASLDYLLRGEEITREREPDVFPPALSAAAEEQGWSFVDAQAALRVRRTIVARRSPAGTSEKSLQQWTKDDWIDFHRKVFQ